MFPIMWKAHPNVKIENVRGQCILSTKISDFNENDGINSRDSILITNTSIPVKEILKRNIRGNNREHNNDIRSPHNGIHIDPTTGIPINAGTERRNSDVVPILDNWRIVESISGPIYYWEVEVISDVVSETPFNAVAIGLVPADFSPDILERSNCFSYIEGSVAYYSDGCQESMESSVNLTTTGYGTHDVVGCGIEIGGEGRVFFTCNGKVVGEPFTGLGRRGQSYYPAILLKGEGTAVKTNLDGVTEVFQFDYGVLNVCNATVDDCTATAIRDQRGYSTNSILSGIYGYPPVKQRRSTGSLLESPVKPSPNLETIPSVTSENDNAKNKPEKAATKQWTTKDINVVVENLRKLQNLLSKVPKSSILTNNSLWNMFQASGFKCAEEETINFDLLYRMILTQTDILRNLQLNLLSDIDSRTNSNETEQLDKLLTLNDTVGCTLAVADSYLSSQESEFASDMDYSNGEVEDLFFSLPRDSAAAQLSESLSSSTEQEPSFSILYTLRRGTVHEISLAVDDLLKLFQTPKASALSTCKSSKYNQTSIRSFASEGGLQALLYALNKTNDDTDLEAKIAEAIAIMIAETAQPKQIMRKDIESILCSLRLLASKKGKLQGVEDTETFEIRSLVASAIIQVCLCLEQEHMRQCESYVDLGTLDMDSFPQPNDFKRGNSGSMTYNGINSDSEAYVTQVLHMILNIIRILCPYHETDVVPQSQSMSQIESQRKRTTSIAEAEKNFENNSNTSHSTKQMHKSHSLPALSQGNNDAEGQDSEPDRCSFKDSLVSDVEVKCSVAIATLSQLHQKHLTVLVAGGVLHILKGWFQKVTRICTFRDISVLISLEKLKTLVINTASSLERLTKADKLKDSSSAMTRYTNTRSSSNVSFSVDVIYSSGWIDAQILQENIPSVVCRLVDEFTKENDSLSHQNDQVHGNNIPRVLAASIANSLSTLSSRQQNRLSLIKDVPLVLFKLLTHCIKKRKRLNRQTVKESTPPNETIGPERMAQIHKDLLEESAFLISLSTVCLSGLSYYLSDFVVAKPDSEFIGNAPVQAVPPIVEMILDQAMIDSLEFIMSQNEKNSQLSAYRLISMLLEWPETIDRLENSMITEYLFIAALEFFSSSDSPHRSLKMDRGDEPSSSYNNFTNIEEIMRVCSALAAICKHRFVYAQKLFDKGLMKVLLPILKIEHFEIQRQVLKCISAMCPVIPTFTPGVNPKAIFERLKSQSSRNTPPTDSNESLDTSTKSNNILKMQANFEVFMSSLNALASALYSPSSLVQKEALLGLSYLAVDEQLSIGIVESALHQIVNIILDTHLDSDMKKLAENVLVNIGFTQGKKDLEIVKFDARLLADWFYMNRALRLQRLARSLLLQWVDTIFGGGDYAERRARQRFLAFELGRDISGNSGESLYLDLPNGLHVDLRETLDLPGLTFLKDLLDQYVSPRMSQWIQFPVFSLARAFGSGQKDSKSNNDHPSGLGDALLQQYIHLFHAWKLLRNGLGNDVQLSPILTPKKDLFDRPPSESSPFKRRGSGNQVTDTFLRYVSFCAGKGTSTAIEEDSSTSKYYSDAAYAITDALSSLTTETVKRSTIENDIKNGIFLPPAEVQELIDMFIPSKLLQLIVFDLLCIGQTAKSSSVDVHHIVPTATPTRQDHSLSFAIPEPKYFRNLLMPTRNYYSFLREGKIIERTIDTISANDKLLGDVESKQIWNITFRDCTFRGDFHATLQNTLLKCPQLNSLSFVSKKSQLDGELGHFYGDIPSTVQYLTFDSALTNDGIRVLSVKLRTSNPTFSNAYNEKGRKRGLIGLSIKNTPTIGTEEIKDIAELLSPTVNEHPTFDKPDPSMITVSGGLKALDLSGNKLTDTCCSLLIKPLGASVLESLDLSGNYIYKGALFSDALKSSLTTKQCRLRYLSVANNSLTNMTYRCILDACEKSTLTYLDCSNNLLTDTINNRSHTRDFLKRNKNLRILDLSQNKFTQEMAKSINLGLLENESLILLMLHGNSYIKPKDLHHLLDKLKLNRDRYINGYFINAHPPLSAHNSRYNNMEDYSTSDNERLSEDSIRSDTYLEIPITNRGSSETAKQSVNTPIHLHSRGSSDSFHVNNRAYSLDESKPLSRDLFETKSMDSPIHTTAVLATDISNHFSQQNVLTVLTAAPLAWKDKAQQLHPIESLDYIHERETLFQSFREARRDITVRFDIATTDTLRTEVTLGCRALHFSGHGHPHFLNFEDGRSGVQFVSVDVLRALCQAGDLKLEFVFVSACYSLRAGEAFASAGVPHVVCVNINAQLLDQAAMVFTRAFYLALAVGNTVQHSFDIGKQAVSASPYVPNSAIEGDKFLLLPMDKSHDVPIFVARPLKSWPAPNSVTALPEIAHLPRPPEDFEGREVDMYRIVTMLHARRLVTVVGDSGLGKSSVVAAICLHLSERRVFEDGIIFAQLAGVSTHREFLHRLIKAIEISSSSISCQYYDLKKKAAANPVASAEKSDPIREMEEFLIQFFGSLKVLIVLDHVNDVTSSETRETVTDMRMFLSRLLERCRFAKVLSTSTDPIGMRGGGYGVVEFIVNLGPLSLKSSLKLFARLSSQLSTNEAKVKFVSSLLVPGQKDVTIQSKELAPATAQILYLLGGGHPGKIVKLACDSDMKSVNTLQLKGEAIIAAANGRLLLQSMSTATTQQQGVAHSQQQQQQQTQQHGNPNTANLHIVTTDV